MKGLYHACLASLYFVNYFNYSFLFVIEFEEFLANYKMTALSPKRWYKQQKWIVWKNLEANKFSNASIAICFNLLQNFSPVVRWMMGRGNKTLFFSCPFPSSPELFFFPLSNLPMTKRRHLISALPFFVTSLRLKQAPRPSKTPGYLRLLSLKVFYTVRGLNRGVISQVGWVWSFWLTKRTWIAKRTNDITSFHSQEH